MAREAVRAERGGQLRRILRAWVLLARGPASVEDLARELGAQPRTVRRDLEQLRLAGAPVREARTGRSSARAAPGDALARQVDRLVAACAAGATIAALARREGTRQSLVSRALRDRGVTIRRGPAPAPYRGDGGPS